MKIDLKKGDTILGGKFKNKKYVVDDFEKDENNQPIIKTKSKKKLKALSFRIDKLMPNNKEKKNENKELSLLKILNEGFSSGKLFQYIQQLEEIASFIRNKNITAQHKEKEVADMISKIASKLKEIDQQK
jgi:hypothetical protein